MRVSPCFWKKSTYHQEVFPGPHHAFCSTPNGFYRFARSLGRVLQLVVVCMFSGWMEWDLTRFAAATTAIKKLGPEITPHVGITFWISRTHYRAKDNPLLEKTTGYSLKCHTLCHPASSGQVECKNLDIKDLSRNWT